MASSMLSSILLAFLIPVVDSLADLSDQMQIVFSHISKLDYPSLLLEVRPTLLVLGDFTRAVLPFAISLLILYFAFLSIWRSVVWAVKVVWFFMKWGTILAVVAGGVGWIMGGKQGVRQFNDAFNEEAALEDLRYTDTTNSNSNSHKPGRPWEPFTARDKGKTKSKTMHFKAEGHIQGEASEVARKVMDFISGQVWSGVVQVVGEGQWLADTLLGGVREAGSRRHERRYEESDRIRRAATEDS